jgi:hypothetical protein
LSEIYISTHIYLSKVFYTVCIKSGKSVHLTQYISVLAGHVRRD